MTFWIIFIVLILWGAAANEREREKRREEFRQISEEELAEYQATHVPDTFPEWFDTNKR